MARSGIMEDESARGGEIRLDTTINHDLVSRALALGPIV